jgi:hypothetical protein
MHDQDAGPIFRHRGKYDRTIGIPIGKAPRITWNVARTRPRGLRRAALHAGDQ